MANEDNRTWAASLRAGVEERFVAPFKQNAFAGRTWFLVTLVAILSIYAGLLAFLLYRDSAEPTQLVEETPVEVIVEPPKPPPPPPPPQQKQETKPEIEKPASSAPRAPNEEKVETQQIQKETHAPKAPTPPKDGAPDKTEAASPSTEPAPPEKAEDEAQKKDVMEKDAEALDKAVPEPPKRPQHLVAKAKPPAKVKADRSALDRLAGDSSLPDFSFARPTKKAPVTGGTEDYRYLAVVYGMIMQHRRPIVASADASGSVTITFGVDDAGNFTGANYVRSSGDPAIDQEALAAIRRASPFPPPPPGAPHSLIATIDFGDTGAR
jgi:protein TonB